MRRAILFLALTLASGAVPMRAQAPAPAVEAEAPAPAAAQPVEASSQALPAQSGPPRTLRAYWHVFAAFTFAWVCILGYAVSLARRFRRLEGQVDALTAERTAV